MRVRLSRLAARDRDAAIVYYGERSTSAGRRFHRRLRETLLYIQRYPRGAPILTGTMRARIILGFPYSVVYEIVDDEILVASIACHYRAPSPEVD